MRIEKHYSNVQFKALPDENGKTGRFEALVAVFGNVDLQGDRIMPGAFTKSLTKWRASGDPIPIIWSHSWGDPFAHVGVADPALAQQTRDGLKLTGTIDTDTPVGVQVYKLLKQRRVKEWSFAYDVIDERTASDKANELVELDIIEAGMTLKGANPDTETIAVKSALETAVKHGAAPSYLQQAHDAIVRAGAKCAAHDEGDKAAVWYAAEERWKQDVDVWLKAEKAEGKPWHIEERDGEFCVIANESSETVACHESREEAEAQMRALYASESAAPAEAEKSDRDADLKTKLRLLLA